MKRPSALAYANIHFLRQALELLRALDDDTYCATDSRCYPSGIGSHLRHNLDHYRSFLDGLTTGRVDYDARERDVLVEADRTRAMQQIDVIVHQLTALGEEDTHRPLLVKMDCDGDDRWVRSTLDRELQFLISHTVHHYALIALIARLQGHEPGDEFGVAPSTLHYRQELSSCAPPPGSSMTTATSCSATATN
jgi:uncharacterized damage-inducible protein DinB